MTTPVAYFPQRRAAWTKNFPTQRTLLHCILYQRNFWLFTFVLELLNSISGAKAADVPKHQAGQNSSVDVTQIPASSSSTQDPDDMTLEQYRQASGGSLPPGYSLAAAAVGAVILILLMILVGVLTLVKNKFCTKRPPPRNPLPESMDMVSIDQSKASTSSNSRSATIKFKKNSDKLQFEALLLKEKTDVSSETRKNRTSKRDLEMHPTSSRKSSTSTIGSPAASRDNFVSMSSLPNV